MRKTYTLVTIFTAFIFSFAQAQPGASKRPATAVAADPSFQNMNPTPLTTQTLVPTAFSLPCAAQKWYYYYDYVTPIDTGYLFGNNKYGESECSQVYKWEVLARSWSDLVIKPEQPGQPQPKYIL
jgi:hypothetical protein